MSETVHAVGFLNLVAFVALGVISLRGWLARRDPATGWAAASFGVLGAVVLIARAVPQHPHGLFEGALLRFLIVLLVVFPYFLFRFTNSFGPPSRRLFAGVSVMTVALSIWTFALPSIPEAGEPRSAAFNAYLVVFVAHWTILSIASAVRLIRAGRGQPSVARWRMRMLVVAAVSITLAIILAAASNDPNSPVALAQGVLGFVSAVAFWLGLAPPRVFRIAWRRPEQERVQRAIGELMTLATTQAEIAERVLAPAADIVGARAMAVRNSEGDIVGSHNLSDASLAGLARGGRPKIWEDAEVVELEVAGGSMVVWTSPYAPFFGEDELALLRTLGALTGLALDRVRLFEAEHQARVALERTNEVMAEFIALAAHELRTPVTTIYGFVRTLRHLSERLSEAQREELGQALEQQTERMTLLVEQLLDLSRLDAHAVEIRPERIPVREQVERVVAAAVPDRRDDVRVEVDEEITAHVDRDALDRIVSNLVTNALKYGRPPVTVRAGESDRHFRLVVEDSGEGVAADFVPSLFERFARSEGSRGRSTGTGLGLAIARSYARAHRGDLLYRGEEGRGAAFELVLPRGERAPAPAGNEQPAIAGSA
jgi:signal transduction histidine kinase